MQLEMLNADSLLLQVSMKLKLAQMWDHNGTNMEVRSLPDIFVTKTAA